MTRYLTILLVAFFILPSQASATKSKLDLGITSEIKHVTVFLNGAQVTREFKSNIKSGTQLLKVKELTPYLDPKTIQVKGNGNFTILSTRHQINYLDEKKLEGEIKLISDSIVYFQKKSVAYATEIAVLNESEVFLQTNRAVRGSQDNLSVNALQGVHQYYFQELLSLRKNRNELTYKKREVNLILNQFRNQLNEINKQLTKNTGEIIIEVQAEKATSGNFEVSYLVNHAGWYPSYDIRVKDINNPLQLVYKANVHQNTGVDWDGVMLTFSNANPYQSGDLPVLRPYYLNYTNGNSYNKNPYKNTTSQNSYKLDNYISSNNSTASGRVIDNQGNAVPFATIRVQGTSIGTITDEGGNFSLTLPQGKNQVFVSYIGHQDKYQNLNTNGGNTIVLNQTAQKLQEVAVVAAKRVERADDVQVYSSRSINKIAGITMSAPKNRAALGFSAGKRKEYVSKPITVVPLENQTSLEISLPMPFTIKSTGKQKVVSINSTEIPAYYEYRSVPKLEKAAFLIARISDWSEYNLLAGEANLYFENTYIGKSILDVRFLTDTLNISLGRDKGVLVNRQKVKSQSSREFIGSDNIEKRSFELEVRNNKKQAINLIVYDQVPISQRPKDIEVVLKEHSGAKHSERTGELKWEFELLPSTSKKLNMKYQVKFPKNRNINLE